MPQFTFPIAESLVRISVFSLFVLVTDCACKRKRKNALCSKILLRDLLFKNTQLFNFVPLDGSTENQILPYYGARKTYFNPCIIT